MICPPFKGSTQTAVKCIWIHHQHIWTSTHTDQYTQWRVLVAKSHKSPDNENVSGCEWWKPEPLDTFFSSSVIKVERRPWRRSGIVIMTRLNWQLLMGNCRCEQVETAGPEDRTQQVRDPAHVGGRLVWVLCSKSTAVEQNMYLRGKKVTFYLLNLK